MSEQGQIKRQFDTCKVKEFSNIQPKETYLHEIDGRGTTGQGGGSAFDNMSVEMEVGER